MKRSLAAVASCLCLIGVALADDSIINKTESALERGAEATRHGIEVGLSATGRGIRRGAEATGHALEKAAEKISPSSGS